MELEVKGLYRPCLVGDEKALFHRWVDLANEGNNNGCD